MADKPEPKNGSATVNIYARVSEETFTALERLAKNNGRTVSAEIRHLVETAVSAS
jgi:predicted DNA-binding protein